MEYDILKENTPDETVTKIKRILKQLNIEVTENIQSFEAGDFSFCSSLRVNLKGNVNIGANGKGSSLINAKASAYAEFMERLQSQFLFLFKNDEYIYSPDERVIDDFDLGNNIINYFFNDKDFLINANTLANKICYGTSHLLNKSLLVPFYSYKYDSVVDLPIYLISLFQGSTGLSAGNTIEEALVQGLSEVCERYVQKKVISENISLPNIPSEKYIKYKRLRTIIDAFNNNEYQVLIKDASLGLKLPVICAVILDKKENLVSIKFGAHPSFPIAVERCLTEFAQGYDVTRKERAIPYESYISKAALKYIIIDGNLKLLAEKMEKSNVFIENCDYIQHQFYDNTPDYKFSESSFINPENNVNNAFCLEFLIDIITKITDDIYIRDISFLGFPTVVITIPKMLFPVDDNYKLILENRISLQKYIEDGMPIYPDVIASLYKDFISQTVPIFYTSFPPVLKVPYENLILLFSILMKDYKNIKKYTECFLQNRMTYKTYKKSFINIISIANKYFGLLSRGCIEAKILKELNNDFSQEEIKTFLSFLKFLSFENIKEFILKYKISNKNNFLINTILGNIIKKQKKHVIIQKSLSEVFKNNLK